MGNPAKRERGALGGPRGEESGSDTPVGRRLTLGTAGHIDHGKTTLVKALTGRDTDRLKEEKERGISIELGYAELRLPSGRTMSVVDVPGHERFVKTMVAGASGIDLFLLVVAADDGVMPQTSEHLRILELLGIPMGLVALTKIDMVDDGMADLARDTVKELLDDTTFKEVPIVPVSGVTGQGITDLLAALDGLAAVAGPRSLYPATRMPVDRVFSLKGVGTVVTGTLWSGSLGTEDRIVILPPRSSRGTGGQREVRVRGVQVHDREVPAAEGGQRVAINLTGVDRGEVARGQWVVKDPSVEPTYVADVRLTLTPDSPRALPRISRARVEHGTAELLAKVVLVDRQSLSPGASGYAQLRFEQRALLYPGDRFVLRSVTPVTTIGGGSVIDPTSRKHSTDPRWRERLTLLEKGSADAVAALLLAESFPRTMTSGALEASPYLWRFELAEVRQAVADLVADGRGVSVVPATGVDRGPGEASSDGVTSPSPGIDKGGGLAKDVPLLHGPALDALREAAAEALQARAEEEPLDPYMSLGALRQELLKEKEAPALDAALEGLHDGGAVVRSEHGYRWAGAAEPTADGGGAAERLLAQFEGAGKTEDDLGPEVPTVTAAAESAGVNRGEAQKVVAALVRENRLIRVGEDLYYPVQRLQSLIDRLVGAIEAAGQLTLAEARDLLGTSRRYAQALLEHMDSEGLTLRVGDARRLRSRRRK